MKDIIAHMLEISVPGWIWCFASVFYSLYVCQELKSAITVVDLVQVDSLVLSRCHINALVVLLPIILVLGHSNW